MLNVTNLSTLNIAVSIAVSTLTAVACQSSASVTPTTSHSSTTKLAACTLLWQKTFFYCFFLHQTQSKRYGNVLEKAWWTLFTPSLVLDMPVCLVRRLGRWAMWVGWRLAASYTPLHHSYVVALCSGVHVATVCSDWLRCKHDCGGSGGQCSRNL